MYHSSINCIVAVDNKNGISKDGVIPWSIIEDMNLFSYVTSTQYLDEYKNVVIMGKNTWLSIDQKFRPLKNRINVIVSSTLTNTDEYPDVKIVKSLEEALHMYMYDSVIRKIFIIGGSKLYNEIMNNEKGILDNLYVTYIHDDYNCDNIINLDVDKFELTYNKSIELYDTKNKKNVNVSFRHYVSAWDDKLFDKYVEDTIMVDNKEEKQYLHIMKELLDGHYRQTRNSKTYSQFGKHMKYDLSTFPLLTTKKMFLRGIFEELKFFLLGHTNTKILEEKGVNIWKGNTSKEFIELCKLPYEEGDMGPMYGFQLRHFGATYTNCTDNYTDKGFDQLKNVINILQTDRFNRRIMMTTFNPAHVHLGVLPPCHGITIQFGIEDNNKLCCHMYQRSGDWFLGVPFNIASYALLVYIICNIVNNGMKEEQKELYGELVAGTLIMSFGDAHIYDAHIDVVKEQIKRKPFKFPTLKIIKSINTIDDIKDLEFSDIVINNYVSHNGLKANMVA